MYEKIKNWFKKNKTLLSFCSGVVSAISAMLYFIFDERNRNSRNKQNIERLNDSIEQLNTRLRDADRIIKSLEQRSGELTNEFQNGTDIVKSKISELRTNNDRVYKELSSKTDTARQRLDEITKRDTNINGNIKRIARASEDLRKFIETHGVTK